jgi:hypothetical protein
MKRPTDPNPQETTLAEIYDRMMARDEQMWTHINRRDSKLQDRMMELFSRILDNSSVDRVMVAGFTTVSDQLKEQLSPLRDLTPHRAPLDTDQKVLLHSLRIALDRPDYALAREDIPGRLIIIDNSGNDGRTAS